MSVLAIVIGLLGALVLLYSMSIPAIFAGPYFVAGVILVLAAIGLFIYGSKEAEKKAATPEGIAAAKVAAEDTLLKETPPPMENPVPVSDEEAKRLRAILLMIVGGIALVLILVATLG
jgi:hypothetical protein